MGWVAWLPASAVLLLIVTVWQALTLRQVADMMCPDSSGLYIVFDPWFVTAYATGNAIILLLAAIAWRRSRSPASHSRKRFTIMALSICVVSWFVAGASLFAATGCA